MLQYTWLALETILRATSFSQFELAPWSYNTLCARNQITISHLISSTNKATDRIVWSTNLQAHKNIFRELTKCSEPSTWAIWVSCCAWYFEVFLLDTKSKFLAAFSFERSIGVMYFEQSKQLLTLLHISMVSCQKGPTRHADRALLAGYSRYAMPGPCIITGRCRKTMAVRLSMTALLPWAKGLATALFRISCNTVVVHLVPIEISETFAKTFI